jgi:hypothetical protein
MDLSGKIYYDADYREYTFFIKRIEYKRTMSYYMALVWPPFHLRISIAVNNSKVVIDDFTNPTSSQMQRIIKSLFSLTS